MLMVVVRAGGACAALAWLLISAAGPLHAGDQPAGAVVEIEVEAPDDPRWELSRVDVSIDGVPQPAAEADAEADRGPRPVWTGVIAPGPHTLTTLLVFRPRDPDLAGSVSRTLRVETLHDFPTAPIRPLVLLITPVRPQAPPSPDLILASYTLAAAGAN